MQSSTRDAREAREARARLYSTTTNFADKKTTARTLLADLVGASDGAKRAGAGIDGVTTHGTATAAVLTEWSLATLAWAGVSADIVDSKQNLKGTGSNQRDTKSGGGGGAFGSPAKKQKKNNNASVRPPRAVGVEAPDAEIVCCDGVLWSVLVTSLRFMDSQNSTNYKPNATAATHVLRAACVAFSQTSRNEKTLNLATETLGLFEHTLGSKFKPTPEQCLLAVKTSTHGARVTVHFNYFVRLMSRSITQNPRKLPPAIDDDTLDTLLERAAAEVGSINSSVNSSTPHTDALDFLQSVFLHPAYLDTVPTAFGEINKGKSKAKGKTKGSKKAEDAEDNSDDEDTRTPKTPPELVRVVARRILKAACEGVDCGTLAPWAFKSFVQETTRSTQTRGGVASSSGGSSIASTAKLLGPCRLLWDSLFAPISEAESLRTTGITTGTRHITCVASDLVKEMNKAGLYSQTAEGGGPAPKKNSKPPRDRLERYASAIFANESVSPESAAKALRSLVELDVRLVEPYLSNAIAKVWQASESNDVVSETIAEVVKAHADTRRLPEFLTAAGAAAAELNAASVGQEKGKGKRGGAVFSTEIVLAAAQEAGHRVPPGQIKDVVLAAREATNAAFSFANGTKKFKKSKLSRGTENGLEHSAVERVASMCGFIATLISSLPAPPGAALPSAANDALTGFAKDLVEVMRKWCVSVEARGGGDSSGKKEKSSKESKNKRKRDVSNGSDFSLDGFDVTEHDKIDAVRVGAALVAYAAVAAMLEVCHDGDDLHGRARVPYLDVDDDDSKNPSLSLAQVAAWVLQLSNDSVGSHKTGVGIAGACVHRLAQLAPAALPPPAGEGDAAAVEEAKSLVLVLTNDEVLNNESFSTVEEVLRSCEDVWTPFASAEVLAKWTRTRDAVMKETSYPNAPSLDEPEILAARVNTAAFDVLAAARDVLSKLDSKGKANKSVTRCELVINDTAKRLDGDRDASGKSSVAKFWQDVGDEKDEKMKKADKKRKANESSLHSALARLTQIPPCVAARVLDPCALVYVLAVADCVSFQTNGHSSTGVCSVSRSFAARVAERDASAAREITKFLPALLEASVGENVIDCDDTETDESLFTTSTIAVASLTHAALSQSTDEDAVRNVVAVVEPAVRRMVAETKAVAAQRTSSEAIANGTESKNSKSNGMVPRVVNKKRKAEITSSTGVQLSRLSARAASLAEAVLVAATNKVPTQTDESKFERTKDAIVGAVASKFRIETKPLRIAVGDAVALLHSANAFRDAVGVSLNLNRFTAETAASALAASGASSHVADLCARHCDGAVLDADPVDETAVRICVMVAVDVLAVSSRDTMVTSLSKLSDPSLKLASESVLVAAATAGARCVSLLDATGPSLEPDAHAALLATVAGAYDAAARRMSDESSTDAIMLPAPSQKLKLALDFFLVTLLKGAGKRLLGAGYRAAVGTLRDVDGFYRRMSYETCMSNYPNRSYPEEFGSTSSLAAMPLIANTMAMPIWLLEFLCKGNNSASKSALNANAEILLNAIVAPARNACESMESVGDAFNNTSHGKHTDGESYRHAVGITHASITLTNLLVSKKGIGLSSRCVARIGQMPSTLVGVIANCQISQMRDASIFVFVPLCSVLTACLRFRKQELKRSTAIIVHACVSLLDVLRQWHTRRVRVLKETNQLESEISVIDSACKRCASSLVAVYEEAVRSGFGRYCAHLLSDAVTVTSGGDVGIGQVAMEALKPGVFALLDGVGDRELGQMHAAFGSAGGGARRVTLSNLIEEHKRSHKYDGKV